MTATITIKTNEREVSFTAGPPVAQTIGEKTKDWLRAGSWAEFVRRFDPLEIPEGGKADFCNTYMWETRVGLECDHAHVWTVVDIEGELYLCEGWHFVNRLGYIIAKNPRAVMPKRGDAYKTFKY
jgi:hypothetical protein